MTEFVNTQNARPGGYDKVIADIAEKKVCPFCPDHLEEFHKNPLDQRRFWIITNNMYPYQPSVHHKLLIHREHIEHVSQITSEAWVELGAIVQEQTAANTIIGGTFIMRFGDTRFTGASVTHLHANLVQSNPSDSTYDPAMGLRTRIG
jgi:ATP adenylyltransferase